jgi:hypothetical protein
MIKVKELKTDAVIQIPVNKGYYVMAKNLAIYLLERISEDKRNNQEYIKEITTKKYTDLDKDQQSLQTISLLIAEIEAQALNQNQFEEKEILEPGDEGYVAPTED